MADLTKCEACRREISKEAKVCPGCGQPISTSESPLAKKAGCGSWALFAGVCIGALFGVGALLGSRHDPKGTAMEACIEGQRAVMQRLKSPTTADFGDICGSYDSHTPLAAGQLVAVGGTVDAENGFGAKLRSNWSAVMVRTDRGWSASEIHIDK